VNRLFGSLRGITTFLVICAFLASGIAVWFWVQSNANWRAHKQTAYVAGITLYNGLQNGTSPAANVSIMHLSNDDQAFVEGGDFRRISSAPHAARLTIVPITADIENLETSAPLTLAVLSPDLTYHLADLPHRDGQTAAETTGEVFRLLASYCSDPIVVGQFGDAPWVQIDGSTVWNCDIAPSDWRLITAFFTVIAMAALMTVTLNLSTDFELFAEQLRNRRRLGGPARYESQGPSELKSIVSAVNSYLEVERAQLEARAAVLSGVSHDLGSPATRLRLRAALIEDTELRHKLEADIDSMSGMIESVLTYTRAEMNSESPRKLSLNTLIDAIIANYEDTGSAVSFRQSKDVVVRSGSSVFMSRQGKTTVAGDRDITVTGRPIALERAISNLIDNALKYGRRATLALETDAVSATIIVEDEGSESSATDIEALMAPFKRGENTATIDGYGLGLTIVATIAKLHGGQLTFEDTSVGVAAHLTVRRHLT
jgi:two-component system, OmpR family, osmolarity sensor histidine kinase EnvZ